MLYAVTFSYELGRPHAVLLTFGVDAQTISEAVMQTLADPLLCLDGRFPTHALVECQEPSQGRECKTYALAPALFAPVLSQKGRKDQ